MSVEFVMFCKTCEEEGPVIRYGHTGPKLMPQRSGALDADPVNWPEQARGSWALFLGAHEFCVLELLREGHRR